MFTSKVLKRVRKTVGSWLSAAPPRQNPRRTVKLGLEALEERWCPAGGQGNTDTMIWEPQNGSKNAGLASNWFDEGTGLPSTVVPTASNPVIFDGTKANMPITIGPLTVKTMTLQDGYNKLMTISSGGAVTDSGTFTEDDTSTLNVYFNDKTTFTIAGGGNITNMTLSGYPSGTLILSGGTTEIAESSSYNETTGVNILVQGGTVLQDDSWTPLKFTNSNLQITVAGTMRVYYGSGTGATLIDRNGFSNDLINVSGGNLIYLGNGGVADTFNVQVTVQSGGYFYVTSADGANNGAKLTVTGLSGYYSVAMTGATSAIELNDAATLECDYGYNQSGGTLETTDATTCTLKVGSSGGGTADITGGSVSINTPNTGYGTLNINGNLDFTGTLNVAIQGNASGAGNCDSLKVTGTMTINNGSTLDVSANGNLVGGNSWVIISSGAPLNQYFPTFNRPAGVNQTLNSPNGSYLLSY